MADSSGQATAVLTVDQVLKYICSHLKLDRDRGVSTLEKVLKSWECPADELTRLVFLESTVILSKFFFMYMIFA